MTSPTAAVDLDDEVVAFGNIVRKMAPYDHVVSPQFYTKRFAETLLRWLESEPDWRLKETVLYKQYELGFTDFTDRGEICGLWDASVLARLRDLVSRAFDVSVSSRINISAHKLVSGQHASVHTDNGPDATHRVVVQLNRGRADDEGGNLVLLSGPTPTSMAVVFKQVSNSAIGFRIGPTSHHAIGRVKAGTRFTIIYTFLSDAASDAKYDFFVAA